MQIQMPWLTTVENCPNDVRCQACHSEHLANPPYFELEAASQFAGVGDLAGIDHTVEERYAQNDQLSTFRDVVGDGTLWMVLVAMLGNSQWHGVGAFIDKAIALREVFTSSQLLASAQPERIAGLLGKIRIEDARTFLAKVAPAVTDLLGKIDDLRPIWEQEMRAQMNRLIKHKAGDLLWRENIGWAVCLAEARASSEQHIKVRLRGTEKQIVGGFYVNVTDLADRNPVLAKLINDVRTRISENILSGRQLAAAAPR